MDGKYSKSLTGVVIRELHPELIKAKFRRVK